MSENDYNKTIASLDRALLAQDAALALIRQQSARIAELEAELGNIADAKSENFNMSGDFVDWARSRARWTLRENPNRINLNAPSGAGGE